MVECIMKMASGGEMEEELIASTLSILSRFAQVVFV